MATKPWGAPVTVFAGRAGNVRMAVRDAAKAADVLLRQWPRGVPQGESHLQARLTMLRCLEGRCSPEAARAAFVAAAEEAGILA